MRTLLFFALIIIAAGGYLAYFNDVQVSLTVYKDIQVEVPVIPLLLGCVALGLVLGLLGTLWQDFKGVFSRMGANRRRKRSDKVVNLFKSAEREQLAGRVAKARTLFHKVTKIDPEHAGAIAALGDIARDKGAAKEALGLHRLVFRLDPDNPAHRLAMVDDYLAMEAFESAAQMIDPGLAEDPKNQTLLLRLRQAQIGSQNWEGAVEAQRRLIKSPMDGLDSRQERDRLSGLMYESALDHLANGRAEQGRNGLINLIRESADFAPAHMSLADLLLRDGKTKEALGQLRDGYERTRDESFLPPIENLIIVHMEDPREALHYFSGLVERDPKSHRLRYYLARVYYRLEMIDDAIHVLTQLDQQVESFPELKELIGRINLRRGQIAEANAALTPGAAHIPYACTHCHVPSPTWQAYCEPCGTWGSIAPKLHVTPEQGSGAPEPTVLLPAPA